MTDNTKNKIIYVFKKLKPCHIMFHKLPSFFIVILYILHDYNCNELLYTVLSLPLCGYEGVLQMVCSYTKTEFLVWVNWSENESTLRENPRQKNAWHIYSTFFFYLNLTISIPAKEERIIASLSRWLGYCLCPGMPIPL